MNNSIKTTSLVGLNTTAIANTIASAFGWSTKIIKTGPQSNDSYHIITILIYKDDITQGLVLVDRGYYNISCYNYFLYDSITNTYTTLCYGGYEVGRYSSGTSILYYIKNDNRIVFSISPQAISGPVLNQLVTFSKYTNINNEIKENLCFFHFGFTSGSYYVNQSTFANYKIGSEEIIIKPSSSGLVDGIQLITPRYKFTTNNLMQMKPILLPSYNVSFEGLYYGVMSPISNNQKQSTIFSLNDKEYITMSFYGNSTDVKIYDIIVDITI